VLTFKGEIMKYMQSALERALPIVAAAYGDQFGVNVVLSGSDAYTDGKTIVIPLLDSMSEMRDVLFGYLAHEAAHVRDSNFDVCSQCQSAIEKTFTNLLEDIRIEKLIQEEFPGTQFTLDTMWTYVVEKGMCPPSQPDQNEASQLCQYLLHRLRSGELGRSASTHLATQSQAVVENTFPKGFFVRLDGLLGKYVPLLSTTDDCLVLARAILKALSDAEEEERANQEQDGETDLNDQPGSSAGNQGCSQSQEEEENSPPNDGSNPSMNGGNPLNAGDKQSLGERLCNETDLPVDAISQLKENLTAQAQKDNNGERFTIDATGVGSDALNAGDTGTLESGILASSVIRSRLLGLLQAQRKTKQWLHTKGKKVDGKRITRLASGDTRVFIQREEHRQPETAVHVLLDASGSMAPIQDIANQATVSLALAVSSIPKCDIASSMFPGHDGEVSPVIRRGQPVRANLGRFAVCSSGGTPLSEAMLYAARELAQSKRERKVLIIITDGAPCNGASVKYLEKLISNYVDIYAIGICSNAVNQYFKNWTVINDVKELQSALFDVAGKFLNVN
jgi:Mg-chelatase subunit ChlD